LSDFERLLRKLSQQDVVDLTVIVGSDLLRIENDRLPSSRKSTRLAILRARPTTARNVACTPFGDGAEARGAVCEVWR
jgi:hypothetical protein